MNSLLGKAQLWNQLTEDVPALEVMLLTNLPHCVWGGGYLSSDLGRQNYNGNIQFYKLKKNNSYIRIRHLTFDETKFYTTDGKWCIQKTCEL